MIVAAARGEGVGLGSFPFAIFLLSGLLRSQSLRQPLELP